MSSIIDDIVLLYRTQSPGIHKAYGEIEDLTVTDCSGKNLWHIAAQYVDLDALKLLKEKEVKICTDTYGKTPLHSLASQNMGDYEPVEQAIYDTVTFLIDAGVNPKKPDLDGRVAYYTAAENGNYPFIRALVDKKIRVDKVGDEGKNILHRICSRLYHRKNVKHEIHNVSQIVKAILSSGSIDPEDKDMFGRTALEYAQSSGVKEVAARFIPDVEDALVTGGMNLFDAIYEKDLEAIEGILKGGADANEYSDKYEKTPLMILCSLDNHVPLYNSNKGLYLEILKLLIKYGADVNYKSGNNDITAIRLLMENFSEARMSIFEYLISNGLYINQSVDNDANTILHIACYFDYGGMINYTIVEKLIEAGADVNRSNNNGTTPLMLYSQYGNEQKVAIAELLIDNGADVAKRDNNDFSAMMYAAGNHYEMSGKRIVELILDATPSVTPYEIEKAMEIAVANNRESIIKLLISYV